MRPRYWGTASLLLALRLLAILPLAWSRALGAGLGTLMRLANGKRRRIARVNLALCFPELAAGERERMLRRHFRLAGQGYLDLGFVAWASERRFARHMRITGFEHLEAAREAGQRVILLAPHCLGMNVGGLVLAGRVPVFSMYKPQRNPLVDWLLQKARSRYGSPLLTREDGLRPALRHLEYGRAFYYLPDEDLGPKHSVFADFFGVPTATLPTLGRLARLADAVVIPCFTRLLPGGRGYEVVLKPPMREFPTGDRIEDTRRMNQALERGLREMPEQYMWTLKLFRTRPHGAPSPYA